VRVTLLGFIALAAARALAGGPPDDVQRQFERRLAAVSPHDLTGRTDLAAWAERQGLGQEAEQLYRKVLIQDPLHDDAYSALGALTKDQAPPRESDPYHAARKLLPPHFLDYETKRFVVISDAEPRWTRSQAERLERGHHQFHRFARRFGLRPLPLRHKLVCVLFKRREDYQQFAQKHDGVSDPQIAGYYSPRNDRVVFYDVESNPHLAEARATLSEIRAEIQQMERQASQAMQIGEFRQAEAIRKSVTDYQRHYELQRSRVEQFAVGSASATTLHEAVHQLLFHTWVQSPHIEYPLWICEGLATTFETETPNQSFGPDVEYPARRRQFQQTLDEGRIVPLRQLVSMTRMPDTGEESVQAIYHESYALVTWMQRYRRAGLRDYLLAMRTEPRGRPDSQRHLELFEQAFGDIEQLERAWLRHEKRGHRSRMIVQHGE
jgi:hypothetical protein